MESLLVPRELSNRLVAQEAGRQPLHGCYPLLHLPTHKDIQVCHSLCKSRVSTIELLTVTLSSSNLLKWNN